MLNKLAFLAHLVVFTTLVQGAPKYTITDLGTLGGDLSLANALNEHGHVVGQSRTATKDTRAFVYRDGKMTNLGTLGGNYSYATGINDAGIIVGNSKPSDKKEHHGFVYQNGTMTDIGTLGGDWCITKDINNQGLIVGLSSNSDQKSNAFLYKDNKMHSLGVLLGVQSVAHAISEKGQITGITTYKKDSFDMHTFIYTAEKMTDIDPAGNESYAFDINIKGEATGWRRISSKVSHPFIYTEGKITEFETLGGESAHGNAINDHSQIVGESKNKDGERRAFLYENGKTLDLNDLIEPGQWTLIQAKDINNKGQITGYGINAKGQNHAFLMTPVTK